MAGDLIEFALRHQRGHRQEIAAAGLFILHKPLERLNDLRALRQYDRQALPDAVHRGEVFQFASQFVMVAFARLLLRAHIFLQFLLARESVDVHAAQHRALGIPAPVCARCRRDLERIGTQFARVGHVRAAAEVHKIVPRIVQGDFFIFVVVNQFQFVGLVGKNTFRLFDADLTTHEILAPAQDVLHPFGDGGKILRRDGVRHIEIVVEPVVNGRTDGQLHIRIQFGDRLGQNVRQRMPTDLDHFFFVFHVFHRVFLSFFSYG